MAWESKHNTPCFYIYKDTINDRLEKLKKYYSRFDKKPSYILALGTFHMPHKFQHTNIILALHPYFKLAYIKLAWGGAAEQAAEHADGNVYVKNWQDEVQQILENAVHCQCIFLRL